MEIIVEIGDEMIQSQIKKEIENLLTITDIVDPPIRIHQVFVPIDFDGKVNQLQGNSDFNSARGFMNEGVIVMAKLIDISEGTCLVLSPTIYHSPFDTMIRCFYLSHEIAHLINRNQFPIIPKNSFTQENYLKNLYTLFDEYFADRFAIFVTERIFTPSESWTRYFNNGALRYLEIAANSRYYEFIRAEIEHFRVHGDVNRHWKTILEVVNVISISTVHGFAIYHAKPEENLDIQIPDSKFFSEKTFALMDYFKNKYEKNENDLSDGIELIRDYLINFGVRFEYRSEGGYIYVQDI